MKSSSSRKSIESMSLVPGETSQPEPTGPNDDDINMATQVSLVSSSNEHIKLIWSDLSYSVPIPNKSILKKIATCCGRKRPGVTDDSSDTTEPLDGKEMTPLTIDHQQQQPRQPTRRSSSPVEQSSYSLTTTERINQSEIESNGDTAQVKMIQQVNSVSVNVPVTKSDNSTIRTILQPQSGYLKGGTMKALMGPSGAGKTTLLNCITTRIIEGVNGTIVVRFESGEKFKRKIRVGFVPQKDHLFEQFTVKETLLFADKINIRNYQAKTNPSTTAERLQYVLVSLDLTSVANEKISNLSGGQVKRTSIAAEMISKPEILILDEPTSGLDSDNSEKVTSLLSNLCTGSNVAICCTIHQPSFEVFNMFNMVYMLNKYGSCIYFGPPTDLVSTLISFGFKEPSNVNPADYAIEIANGRFGSSAFNGMAAKAKSSTMTFAPGDTAMADLRPHIAQSFASQVKLLFARSIRAQVFNSPLTLTKLVANMLMAFMICTLFEEPTGMEDGCWSSIGGFNISRNDYVDKMAKITGNMNFLFMSCMFYMFTCSVTAVMIVATEIVTITKETSNSWYKLCAYFTSRTIVDLLLVLITTTPSIIYKYIGSRQIWIPWRFAFFYVIILTFAAIWDAKGILLGTIFASDYISGLCVCTLIQFPSVFFSGFYVKESGIFWLFRPFTFISDLKYTYEALIIIVYGFHRCSNSGSNGDSVGQFPDFQNMEPVDLILEFWPKMNISINHFKTFSRSIGLNESYLDPVYKAINGLVEFSRGSGNAEDDDDFVEDDQTQPSYVLSYYGLQDSKLYSNLFILVAVLITLRLAIYAILFIKTRRRRL